MNKYLLIPITNSERCQTWSGLHNCLVGKLEHAKKWLIAIWGCIELSDTWHPLIYLFNKPKFPYIYVALKEITSVILASQCLSSKPMSSGIMKYNVIIQWHVAVTPGYFHTGRAVSWVPWWNEIQETGILIWEMPLILYVTSKQVTQPLSLSSVICKVSLIKLAIIDTLWSLAN